MYIYIYITMYIYAQELELERTTEDMRRRIMSGADHVMVYHKPEVHIYAYVHVCMYVCMYIE